MFTILTLVICRLFFTRFGVVTGGLLDIVELVFSPKYFISAAWYNLMSLMMYQFIVVLV